MDRRLKSTDSRTDRKDKSPFPYIEHAARRQPSPIINLMENQAFRVSYKKVYVTGVEEYPVNNSYPSSRIDIQASTLE